MSIGTSLARGSATVAVFALDKTIRVGNAVISNSADFGTTFMTDFNAKNEVAAAKRTVDFAANKTAREQLRAEIAAGQAPVQHSTMPIKALKAAKA